MAAASELNASKKTIICHACAEDITDEFVPCQGFCNAVFHLRCSGVPIELLKEIASRRQIFWHCMSCTNLMSDLRHRRSVQCAFEAGQELSLSHHNRIVEQLKTEILSELKTELSANFAKLIVSNSLTPKSGSLRPGGFRGSGRRLFDNKPAAPAPQPVPTKHDTGTDGSVAAVDNIVAAGYGGAVDVEDTRFWLYLSRVSRSVTEEQIARLAIDRLGSDDIKVKMLVAKGKDVSRMRFISFKIGMNSDLKDKALATTTWPNGLVFREFEERGEIYWEPKNSVSQTPPPPQSTKTTTPKSQNDLLPSIVKEAPKNTEPLPEGSTPISSSAQEGLPMDH